MLIVIIIVVSRHQRRHRLCHGRHLHNHHHHHHHHYYHDYLGSLFIWCDKVVVHDIYKVQSRANCYCARFQCPCTPVFQFTA